MSDDIRESKLSRLNFAASRKEKLIRNKLLGITETWGLEYLAEMETEIVRNKKHDHYVIPSKYREYSAADLYRRMMLLDPDYKGKYAFSQVEIGFGADVGFSIDVAKLILSPLSPVNISLGLEIGLKRTSNIVLLVSRPFTRKTEIIPSKSDHEVMTSNPICFQLLSGVKKQWHATLNANIGIALDAPLSLGSAQISINLIQETATATIGASHYCFVDETPGWYVVGRGKTLTHDMEDIILIGQKKRHKEDVIKWLKSHILKEVIGTKKMSDYVKKSDNDFLKEYYDKLKKNLKNLPERRIWKSVKARQSPFSRPGADEIDDKTDIIIHDLIGFMMNLGAPSELFGEGGASEILSNINWYKEKIQRAKELSDDFKEDYKFPVKKGSRSIGDNQDFLKKMCFAQMSIYGPFKYGVSLKTLSLSLGENKKDSESWFESHFDKRLKASSGFQGSAETIKTNSNYQIYEPIQSENKIIVFTQETKIQYIQTLYNIGDFFASESGPPRKDQSEPSFSEYIMGLAVDHSYGKLRDELLDHDKHLSAPVFMSIKDMEYTSVSAYWERPFDRPKSTNTELKNGSGISYGMSIQIPKLESMIVKSVHNYNFKRGQKTKFTADLCRIAGVLRIAPETLKRFFRRLGEVIDQASGHKNSWRRVKHKQKAFLLETSHRFTSAQEVGFAKKMTSSKNFKHDKTTLNNLHATFKVFSGSDYKTANENYETLGLAPETIRLRYRLADTKNDDFSFSLGLDLGINLEINFSKYLSAGNETIQDYLIYTIDKKEIFHEVFPPVHLDKAVPPVMLLPHSFQHSE